MSELTDTRHLRTLVNGVPVVTVPAEIDITTADQLRAVLLEAAGGGHPAVVVDMTRTQFCDSAGLRTLVQAHKRVLAEGRELRLAIPAGGAVRRIVTLTGIDGLIPCFPSLEAALARTPDGADPRPEAPSWHRTAGDGAKAPTRLHRMVIRLRYGIKGGYDRRPASTGETARLTHTRSRPWHLPSGG